MIFARNCHFVTVSCKNHTAYQEFRLDYKVCNEGLRLRKIGMHIL